MASRTALRWRTPWSMRLPLCAFILALLSPALHAVNLADAGLHDWHMPLIGQPSHLQALSPRFHYPAGPSATSVSSLVYTVTQRNVLAAIEPKAGGIAWRHIFPEDRPILKYVLYGDYILVLSGPAASSVDLFSASTGHSIWSLQQHDPKAGLLPEVGSVAADAIFFEDDIITMANGKDVRRISRETGAVLWQWSLEREKDPTLQIHAILPPVSGNDEVDLLLIRRIPGSYSLATTILSASTGSLIADVSTSKSHSSPGLDSVHAAGNGIAVFLDASGVVHTITAASGAAHSLKGSRFGTLVDVHLSRFGIFVGKKEDDTSAIIEIKSDGSVRVLHEWSAPAIQALYTGFIDRNDIAHVTRFYISKALGLASVSTYTVQATTHNEAGQIFGATMPYRPVEHGQVLSLAMEFAPRKSPTPLFRATLVTSSGSFQGWLGGGKQWSREEGLAHLTSDSLVFLPIKEDAAAVSIDLAAIWSRKSKKTRSKTGKDWLAEAFGYRKLIIAATEFGKIHALDLGNGGEIVWTSYTVPQAMAKRVSWKKLALFDKAHGNQTLLMAVAELENEKNTIATAVFYLDAKTGKPYHDKVMGATAVDGPVREILVLPGSSEPTLLFVTPDDLVYVSTAPASISSSEKVTHSIPRVVLTDLEGMSGATVSLTTGQSPVPARFLWQMAMSSGEHVLATAKQTNGKIASVGRVLPDRSTLRKYLNPHLLAIATNRGVYLIDAVTGLLVWNGDQPASSIALSENWLVYSSGHNLVSVELYENSTSSKTYAFPGRVTSLSMSQTEHGVTTTALLVSTTDQIVSISKGALGLPVDPKWVVSHTNRVAGVKGVFSSPTALESTSQILAYGLDLFGSSISPSGRFDVLSRDFNTWQLAGTTSALLGIIGVLKPMVARKKLKERWDRD